MFSRVSILLGLLLVSLFAVGIVSAQGVIIPGRCHPARRCPTIPRHVNLSKVLPVKSIDINTNIEGQVATTTVTQVFRNPTPYQLEGKYFFPIPDAASIEEFAIWENGKKLVGEVLSKDEARKIYNDIVRTMKDPGLLEYSGQNLIQVSIFPIPARSDKKIELRYSQILEATSGTVAYKYPLGVGSKVWMPPVILNGARRTSNVKPGANEIGTVSAKIEINGKETLRNIYSPSHDVEVVKKGDKTALVTFETKGDASDFQLFYGLSSDEFGMSLMTYREPGKDGYFLFMVSPKDEINESKIVDKDTVFVLDTSGSMNADDKIEKAKAALEFGISTLNKGDRFNVISFAGSEKLMAANPINADSSGKQRGKEFVSKLRASGGTNIDDTLQAALKQFESSDRPKMLVFITDGRPTVGTRNVDTIVKHVKENTVKGLRLFSFGVGYNVNTRLLDKLATENSGTSDYIQPKEDIEIKVSNFFTKVNSPVLSDIKIDFGKIETDLVYPRETTDIFKGMQNVIIGRYKNDSDLKNAVITLQGKMGNESTTIKYSDLDFPKESTGNEFLARLWASRRVGWLMEEIRSNGQTKELKDEIINLGTRFGIVTPYTSYLAKDGSYKPSTRRGRNPAASAQMDLSITGRSGVALSTQQNSMKTNSSVNRARKNKRSNEQAAENEAQIFVEESASNKYVGNKNFVKKVKNWIDSAYDPKEKLPEVNIKFGSDEFFKLLDKEKSLAKFFSVGKNVVVVWNNTVYRVTE